MKYREAWDDSLGNDLGSNFSCRDSLGGVINWTGGKDNNSPTHQQKLAEWERVRSVEENAITKLVIYPFIPVAMLLMIPYYIVGGLFVGLQSWWDYSVGNICSMFTGVYEVVKEYNKREV